MRARALVRLFLHSTRRRSPVKARGVRESILLSSCNFGSRYLRGIHSRSSPSTFHLLIPLHIYYIYIFFFFFSVSVALDVAFDVDECQRRAKASSVVASCAAMRRRRICTLRSHIRHVLARPRAAAAH